MRQRVMLALALAGRPKLLLADEPTTALDVSVQRQILDLVAELRRANHLTVVFVSHDLAVVATVADQIAVMYAGTIVETGPTQSVLEQPLHPYTRALVAAGQALDDKQSRLETIPGTPRALDESFGGCQFEPRCPIARPECKARVPQLLPRDANREVACFAVEAKA
jgi:oligopeptide/dipeptide ABC transporter ATP-binding protein